MEINKKVIEGILPITTTEAVYIDGTSKTLQQAINDGDFGANTPPQLNEVANTDKKCFVFQVSNDVKIIIDNINKKITIPHGMRYQLTSTLSVSTHYNEVILDYSTYTNDVIINLYRNATKSTWEVYGAYYNRPSNSDDLYLVTSFFVDFPKNLTLNSSAIIVKSNSIDEVIELTTLGDSLTSNGGWQERCIRKLNQVIKLNNLGIGGSTLANCSNGSFNPMCLRTNDIPSNTNVLTIMGGTNDVSRGTKIGELSNNGIFDTTTYIGAYESIIKDAYTINPNMVIVLITPPKKFNSDGTYIDTEPFKQATIDVGKRYSLPVLNIHDNLGINEYTKASLMSDNVHLRGNAPTRLGSMLADVIKSIL